MGKKERKAVQAIRKEEVKLCWGAKIKERCQDSKELGATKRRGDSGQDFLEMLPEHDTIK